MSDALIKISKIIPKVFLGVFVALFVLQVLGFFVIYFLGAR
jgi:hypothetical protein